MEIIISIIICVGSLTPWGGSTDYDSGSVGGKVVTVKETRVIENGQEKVIARDIIVEDVLSYSDETKY